MKETKNLLSLELIVEKSALLKSQINFFRGLREGKAIDSAKQYNVMVAQAGNA